MSDSIYDMGGDDGSIMYEGPIPPGFEDMNMMPSEPIEPMTGSAAEAPTWDVKPPPFRPAQSVPQSYAWPAGTDAVYREMQLAGPDAPVVPAAPAPSNLLPMILLALGAGGYLGWKYGGGAFGAAGGAVLGAALVNAYRALTNLKTNKQEAMTSGTWAVAGAAAALYLLYKAREEAGDDDDFDDDDDDDDEIVDSYVRPAAKRKRSLGRGRKASAFSAKDYDPADDAPLEGMPDLLPGGYEKPLDVTDDEDEDEPVVRPAKPRRRTMTANAAKRSVAMTTATPIEFATEGDA